MALENLDVSSNLRPVDLEVLYKFVPEQIKEALLPKHPTLDDLRKCVEVLSDPLLRRKQRKILLLREQLTPGAWLFVRWGKKPDLGRTFLAAVKDHTFNEVCLFTPKKSFVNVPIWWVQEVLSFVELEPVKAWEPMPKLPEKHPVVLDKFLSAAFHNGFFEPLIKAPKDIAAAVSQWDHGQQEILEKIKNLDDDAISALYHFVQEKRIVKERERLEKARLGKNIWILVQPDLNPQSYEVVLLDSLNGSLLVWYPEDDVLLNIPDYWYKRTLQKQKVEVGPDGLVREEDRFKHSRTYRALRINERSKKTQEKLLAVSLRTAASSVPLSDWLPLWTAQKPNFHKLVRERGQSVVDWFGRWVDPFAPNRQSCPCLRYEPSYPLELKIILPYFEEGEHLADFVRAEIDLFEGTVRTPDKSLQATLLKVLKLPR